MRLIRTLPFCLSMCLLAACDPAAAPIPDPVTGVVDVTPGLNEREPDLCKAATFAQYQGQPGSVLQSVNIGRAFRVIPHGGIVTQEYIPGRVNFSLAPDGTISRIGCG